MPVNEDIPQELIDLIEQCHLAIDTSRLAHGVTLERFRRERGAYEKLVNLGEQLDSLEEPGRPIKYVLREGDKVLTIFEADLDSEHFLQCTVFRHGISIVEATPEEVRAFEGRGRIT